VGIATVLDKAGPALASGIVLALLAGATSSALAWRDLQSTSGVRWSWVTEQIANLRGECGERHAEIAGLDARIREQETRPPRLNPGLANAETRLNTLEREVSVLAERIKALEGRIVGVGPNGWHRADHDNYAKLVETQIGAIQHRLEQLEKRK
jgi:septal ring factor EnvC (AmiA/AmiB activator)